MIKTFADKATEELFCTGASKEFPADILSRAIRKLDMVDAAYRVEDLRIPRGNGLHMLTGKRKGQHAISVNETWRICFRFEGVDAFDVELCDYH